MNESQVLMHVVPPPAGGAAVRVRSQEGDCDVSRGSQLLSEVCAVCTWYLHGALLCLYCTVCSNVKGSLVNFNMGPLIKHNEMSTAMFVLLCALLNKAPYSDFTLVLSGLYIKCV